MGGTLRFASSGLLFLGLYVPKAPDSGGERGQAEAGSGGGAARTAGRCPLVSGAKARSSRPPRSEASRSCAVNAKSRASSQPGAADGVLSHSPMRREQIIYSLIPVRVPGAGEWQGLGGVCVGGVGLLVPSPPPAAPPSPPLRAPGAHTHIS